MIYTPVLRSEVVRRVKHIRDLHRQVAPNDESQRITFALREQKTKDLLSNLGRIGPRPTLNLVHEFGRLNSMNTDGAHRLFGYSLDSIRELDLALNGGRTHIVESHIFERDFPTELPLDLAPPNAFASEAELKTLVQKWQRNIPIRELDRSVWKSPGTFYVHVGTEDSRGSGLPPGSTAQVEPVTGNEAIQPDPRKFYVLQFANGYRCSRCVVSRGKLLLLSSERHYFGPEQFSFPFSVRIVGRVRAFGMTLPLPETLGNRSLDDFRGNANLLLPWEHRSRSDLFSAKHRRFIRGGEAKRAIHQKIAEQLDSKLSERSKRRYRKGSDSEPHIDSLIHLSLEHFVRYSDALRLGGFELRGRNRFSLRELLRATRYQDLLAPRVTASPPSPEEVWTARKSEVGEWPALVSRMFPLPSLLDDRVIRIASRLEIDGCEPAIGAGSWMLVRDPVAISMRSQERRAGWSRPVYALQQGAAYLFGRLDYDDGIYALLTGRDRTVLSGSELAQLRPVCAVVGLI